MINSVAARRKEKNNHFFNIQVLIMIQKSICIHGGFALPVDLGLRVAFPHFPMNGKSRRLWFARLVFIYLPRSLKTDV